MSITKVFTAGSYLVNTVIRQNKTPQNKTPFEILGKTALAKIRPLSIYSAIFFWKKLLIFDFVGCFCVFLGQKHSSLTRKL